MKEKIEIRNVLRSDTGTFKGIRLGFCFVGDKAISNNTNYKGYTENACFYNDISLFDKLPLEIIGKQVDCTLVQQQSSRNPMRSISVIETIFWNGYSIRLLQSDK